MLDWLTGWAGLIVGFSGLIFIHELGHFVLAKWNGVHVHVFSVGMGPYIFSMTYRGTVYALSLIPIGGYVKLMGQDDMNANLEPSRNTKDYRNKRAGQKAAILAAGAAFNIIFTIFVFTVCYSVGLDLAPPRLGNVSPNTGLMTATLHTGEKANLKRGDLILKVNDVPVKSFLEAQLEITSSRRSEPLWLEVEQPTGSGVIKHVKVQLSEDPAIGASTIGLEDYKEKMSLPLGFTTRDQVIISDDPKDGPAKNAGLRKGDILLELNGQRMTEYSEFINAVRGSDGKPIQFVIERAGKIEKFEITPVKGLDKKNPHWMIGAAVPQGYGHRQVIDIDESSEAFKKGLRKGHFVIGFDPVERAHDDGRQRWLAGKLLWNPTWELDPEKVNKMEISVPKEGALIYTELYPYTEFFQRESVTAALGQAWDDTLRFSRNILAVLIALFRGDVKLTALSGAAGIGQAMFSVAKHQDFLNFFWFLGFISLNLGVMQFVPIPVLDGGQLVMVFIEKLKGSPIKPAIQEKFQLAGLVIVGGLLLLTTFNDISRFFGL